MPTDISSKTWVLSPGITWGVWVWTSGGTLVNRFPESEEPMKPISVWVGVWALVTWTTLTKCMPQPSEMCSLQEPSNFQTAELGAGLGALFRNASVQTEKVKKDIAYRTVLYSSQQ
jgi:hypothetical protein